jgi:hypothetical protein
MWTARGSLYGLDDVILVWDDGPLGWDIYILRRAIDDVADGVRVGR